ncbi:serine/arginine-rich splicing factor 11-like [Arachis ipaensis]|uniref:serine/arginine-rich splicing factor 11-like n=1 Tax=Arachis ipaensis TaxID=130454 RepID=UPI0007AEFB8F|nr:serine/arginine-rich splicing factor 11-like [Arachis ipaensis]
MQDLERRLAERERDQRSPERSPTRSRSRSRSRRTPSPQYESESTGGRVRPRKRSRDPIIYARHERRRASNRGDEEAHRENNESRRTARGPVIIGATPFHHSDALEQAIREGKLADFSHLIREPRRRNRDNDNEDRSRPTRRRQEPEGDDHGLTVVNVVTARNTAPRLKSAQKKDAKVLAVSTPPVRSLKGLPPISFGPEDQWDRPPAHVASPGRKGKSQTSGPEKEENVAGKGGRGSQANGQPLRSGIHPGIGLLDLVVECGSG